MIYYEKTMWSSDNVLQEFVHHNVSNVHLRNIPDFSWNKSDPKLILRREIFVC